MIYNQKPRHCGAFFILHFTLNLNLNYLTFGIVMRTLAVIITSPPHSPLTVTAISYVESALKAGIKVIGVFFYQGGALHANSNISIASDEYQAIKHWQRLEHHYTLPLHICVTAAEKHGIVCDTVGEEKLNESFTVSGLGELVDLTTKASRLVQF